jgi:hypothetical protein
MNKTLYYRVVPNRAKPEVHMDVEVEILQEVKMNGRVMYDIRPLSGHGRFFINRDTLIVK